MTDDLPSLELLYTETRDRLLRVFAEWDGIDTKASIVAGLDGIVIATVLGLLFELDEACCLTSTTLRPWLLPALTGGGLVAAAMSLLLAMSTYWVRKGKEILEPRKAYYALANLPEEESKRKLLHSMIEAHEDNYKLLLGKAKTLRGSFRAFVVSIALLSVAAGVMLIIVVRCR
jgi:hypothetical protein